MNIDIKEPFRVCPECGYKSEVTSISKSISMFHYYCPACGHEESGVQNVLTPDLLKPEADVIITATWEGTLVSPGELLSLKKIDPRFKNKKPPEIKGMVSFRQKWLIGPLPAGEGYDVYKRAKELGLRVTIKEVQ